MTLGQALSRNMTRLRTEAESLLVDTCELQRRAGSTVDAEETATQLWVTYATTPCRVRTTGVQAREAVTGEQAVTEQGHIASVPLSVPGVLVGDRLVITQSRDATLVGVPLYIKAIPRGTHMVLRRLDVSEDQG